MYPNLGFFVEQTFGIDIPVLHLFQMYGFWLAISFLVSGVVITRELRRRQQEGWLKGQPKIVILNQTPTLTARVINSLLAFFATFLAADLLMNTSAYTNGLSLGNITSHWFDFSQTLVPLLIGVAAGGAYWWLQHRQVQKTAGLPKTETQIMVYPHQRVSDLIIVAAISGLAGAKTFAVIEDLKSFFADPIGMFFSGSGLAFYGGLIGGVIGVGYYANRLKINLGQLIDATAPAVMLAYGVGRLGCHFSGDGDWGIVNPHPKPLAFLPDWLWAYTYPNNVIREGVEIPGCQGDYCFVLPEGVYPTSVYEFLMGVGIFVILWAIRRRVQSKVGLLAFIYLLLNGIERFFIETIRVNDRYDVLGAQLSQAQIIAICLFVIGLVGTIWKVNGRPSQKPELG